MRRLKTPSAKSTEVWGFVAAHLVEKGYPPTIREIATALGFQANSTAVFHLRALERHGILVLEYAVARGIHLLKLPSVLWNPPQLLERRAVKFQSQGALIYWDFDLKTQRISGFTARFPDHRSPVIVENRI